MVSVLELWWIRWIFEYLSWYRQIPPPIFFFFWSFFKEESSFIGSDSPRDRREEFFSDKPTMVHHTPHTPILIITVTWIGDGDCIDIICRIFLFFKWTYDPRRPNKNPNRCRFYQILHNVWCLNSLPIILKLRFSKMTSKNEMFVLVAVIQ